MEALPKLRELAALGYSRSHMAAYFGKSKTWVTKQLRLHQIKTFGKPGVKPTVAVENSQCAVCVGNLKRNCKRYCSPRCTAAAKWSHTKAQIELSCKVNGPRQGRRYLLEKHGNKCQVCALTVWVNKPIPLVLDHIDGNSTNWLLDNLRLICPNCDAQTSTYKGKNRGKGRFSRAQRYRSGQSY